METTVSADSDNVDSAVYPEYNNLCHLKDKWELSNNNMRQYKTIWLKNKTKTKQENNKIKNLAISRTATLVLKHTEAFYTQLVWKTTAKHLSTELLSWTLEHKTMEIPASKAQFLASRAP